MSADLLKGKKILVIGGNAREVIDGVRHYANHGRPELHGLQAARLLAEAGADVTLITTNLHGQDVAGIHVIDKDADGNPLINTRQLLEATLTRRDAGGYDALLQLANFPSVKAAQPSEQKLKVKKEAGAPIPMDVIGNTDIQTAMLSGAALPVAGYNQKLEWFVAGGTPEFADALERIARTSNVSYLPKRADDTLATLRPAGRMNGRRVIITSGPTAEDISSHGDVITNFSSGKQGHAIAESLAQMGARVTLVSGPTYLPDPAHPNIATIHTLSAQEMRDAVLKNLPADAFVGVAAVADFGMRTPASITLAEDEPATLELSQNPDILQTVGTHAGQRPAAVIGFAAETHDLLTYAKGKLEKKGADAICANQVGAAIEGRSSSENQITWVTADGNEPWPLMDKHDVGKQIGNKISVLLQKNRINSGNASPGGNLGIL